MNKRTLQATLLLKTVVALLSVALFVIAVRVLPFKTASLWSLGVVLVVWLVGIEAGLLPIAIERLATARAERRPGSGRSLWFVDVGLEHSRQREKLRDAIRDNPSLR